MNIPRSHPCASVLSESPNESCCSPSFRRKPESGFSFAAGIEISKINLDSDLRQEDEKAGFSGRSRSIGASGPFLGPTRQHGRRCLPAPMAQSIEIEICA
jgi:hypothetical protein